MNIDLLQFVNRMGRIHPEIYDIIPRGPQRDGRVFSALSPGEAVELNPQPIPPGVQMQFAAARVFHEIALAAVAAEAAGNDEAAERIVTRAVDDICGTPRGTGRSLGRTPGRSRRTWKFLTLSRGWLRQ